MFRVYLRSRLRRFLGLFWPTFDSKEPEDRQKLNRRQTLKLIDLTHPLSPDAPTWNGSCGFCLETKKDYDKMFRVQQIKMHAGVGTHMDAPSHRFPEAACIASIPLETLLAHACVIDVSHKADADYSISINDIESYETAHGIIPKGALVIGFTGWYRYFSDPVKYRNVDLNGRMHFPSFSESAAELLLERDIAGIAIDTLSPDCQDDTYPVHRLILGAGKYIIENIADCSGIPSQGAHVIALPLRAVDATECPIRAVALIGNF